MTAKTEAKPEEGKVTVGSSHSIVGKMPAIEALEKRLDKLEKLAALNGWSHV